MGGASTASGGRFSAEVRYGNVLHEATVCPHGHEARESYQDLSCFSSSEKEGAADDDEDGDGSAEAATAMSLSRAVVLVRGDMPSALNARKAVILSMVESEKAFSVIQDELQLLSAVFIAPKKPKWMASSPMVLEPTALAIDID